MVGEKSASCVWMEREKREENEANPPLEQVVREKKKSLISAR